MNALARLQAEGLRVRIGPAGNLQAAPAARLTPDLRALIAEHADGVAVDVLPCPGWATRVETLRLGEPGFAAEFTAEARRHLEATLAAGCDRVVLGCTHYAFLAEHLAPLVAGRAELVDVAEAVARQCERLAGPAAEGTARLTLLATARPERLEQALVAFGLAHLAPRLTGPGACVDERAATT